MLVFSAICPHPPILIPTVGQENLAHIKKTHLAMQKLADEFYASQPETVLIISPHGKLLETAFTINTAPHLTANFKQFGDMETELNFKGDMGLCHQIKEVLETKIPIQLIAEPTLDHGAGVPLYYLSKNLAQLKIIPLGYSWQNSAMHFKLGQELAEIIHTSKQRIAVIASGDLSHCLTKNAPAKYSPVGKKFDKKIVELINQKETDKILNLDKQFVAEAAECGLRSILILLGILSEHNYTPEVLSYEGPFGVGYLVCNFELNR